MAAGIPGTGIGGLFYFLLVLWMPVREIGRTLTGKSNAQQWRAVLFHLTIVLAIITALWVEAWLMLEAMFWAQNYISFDSPANQLIQTATNNFTPVLAMAPVIVLCSVILVVHLLRLTTRKPQVTITPA